MDKMLRYYSQHFSCVELNFTYYGIPKPHVIAGMIRSTPPGFEFTIKANKATTHDLDTSVLGEFKDGIEPARAMHRLAGVLCQFPYGFRNTQDNRAYLAKLAADMREYRMIIEFRHNSWITPPVFDFLREHNLAYCSVDEPKLAELVPPEAVATSDIAYVRFHSRDASKWFRGGSKDRYDYLYTKEELEEWLPRIHKLASEAERTYIFFNNCHAGHAAVNATEFKQMLAELGMLKEA